MIDWKLQLCNNTLLQNLHFCKRAEFRYLMHFFRSPITHRTRSSRFDQASSSTQTTRDSERRKRVEIHLHVIAIPPKSLAFHNHRSPVLQSTNVVHTFRRVSDFNDLLHLRPNVCTRSRNLQQTSHPLGEEKKKKLKLRMRTWRRYTRTKIKIKTQMKTNTPKDQNYHSFRDCTK